MIYGVSKIGGNCGYGANNGGFYLLCLADLSYVFRYNGGRYVYAFGHYAHRQNIFQKCLFIPHLLVKIMFQKTGLVFRQIGG